MTTVSAQEAYDAIIAHMNKQGGPVNKWYAGIAADARRRLFSDHNVSEDNGWWIYQSCKSSSDARAVEKALLEYGCDGGEGGGDATTTKAYAYLKTLTTNP